MGYSAGGYLALLYAYKNPTQIDLVISEAGPTHFVDYNNNIIVNNGDIFSMTGIAWNANGEYSNEAKGLLKQASPYWIVEGTSDKSIFPYTILAYGNGVTTLGQAGAGDGLILYSQATAVYNALSQSNCSLVPLLGVSHWDFGEGQKICPNTTYNDEQGINQIIDAYYGKISSKIQELEQQED